MKCTFIRLGNLTHFCLLLVAFISFSLQAQVHHQSQIIIQAGLGASDSEVSFLDSGTGTLRNDNSGPRWQQGILQLESDWTSSISSTFVINSYRDGHKKLGLSQGFVSYQPLLRSALKYKVRAGMFYPELSVENTDIGWLSPDTYTQSAINSWFGEELRVFGLEASIFKGGRRSASAWSWDAKLGLYQGNDPLGSIIAWRGFATHDRQSLFAERLEFAPYPSVVSDELINHPAWVEPFSELDSRVGAYLGLHLRYLRKTQLKYYYYDNLANPNVVNAQRLYAWRTKFHSIGLQHQLNKQVSLKAQLLEGATLMGENFVHVDYLSAFIQLSTHAFENGRFTFRLEGFDVNERDDIPADQNASHGSAFTINYKHRITQNIEIGSEFHHSKNLATNRSQLAIRPKQIERSLLFLLEYRY